MKRLICAGVALLVTSSAASAQDVGPVFSPSANAARGYTSFGTYRPAPNPSGSARWGYTYYYGSSSYPTWQASASPHPAFAGGSGQFAYHPGFGWGY